MIVEVAKNEIPTICYIRKAQNLTYQFFFSDIKRCYALKRAENVYIVSEYTRKYIVENYNSYVWIVHNCVEDEAKEHIKCFQMENKVIKYLEIGSIEERKQCEVHFVSRC